MCWLWMASRYHVGGRRGELTSIQWSQVDFTSDQIRLRASETKNEETRTLPIYGEMREWPRKAAIRSFRIALGVLHRSGRAALLVLQSLGDHPHTSGHS